MDSSLDSSAEILRLMHEVKADAGSISSWDAPPPRSSRRAARQAEDDVDPAAGVGFLPPIDEAMLSHHSQEVQHAAHVPQSSGSHRYGLRSHDGHSHGANGNCIIDGVEVRGDFSNDVPPPHIEMDDDASAFGDDASSVHVPGVASFRSPLRIRPVPYWKVLLRNRCLWLLLLLLLLLLGGITAAGGPNESLLVAQRTWLFFNPPPPKGPSQVRV
jgi:hypothetical protein